MAPLRAGLTGASLGGMLALGMAAVADAAGDARHDNGTADGRAATITLVMDDLGYDAALARRTLALPPPLTIAILPDAPLAGTIHAAAMAHDVDVMLHLPMEAGGRPPAGRMTLAAGMDEATLRSTVERALAVLPGAIGVNNHEGSRLTADREAMTVLMDELDRRGDLAFVDSRTTAQSAAGGAAAAAGLETADRDVFLDHAGSAEAVDRAIDHWLAHARRTGCALAIAHPRTTTLDVLARRLATMDDTIDRVDLPTYLQRCGNGRGREEP